MTSKESVKKVFLKTVSTPIEVCRYMVSVILYFLDYVFSFIFIRPFLCDIEWFLYKRGLRKRWLGVKE